MTLTVKNDAGHIRDRHLAWSEAELVANIITCAQDNGWVAVHHRPAKTAKGWRTLAEGNAGSPDILCCKGGRVLLIEAKSATGRLSPEQREWAAALEYGASGRSLPVGAYGYMVARPADWPRVREMLERYA